jgi:hypothetical protein
MLSALLISLSESSQSMSRGREGELRSVWENSYLQPKLTMTMSMFSALSRTRPWLPTI